MSDLYDTDIVAWAGTQAELLRRLARGEQINAPPDWPNIAEEIESVGRSEINATLSQIVNVLRHRLYLLGWPEGLSVRRWRAELREFERQLRQHYTPSMTGTAHVTDAIVAGLYADAVEYTLAHMDTDPTQPLPDACPWTLAELLAEGETPNPQAAA
jgi:Domain of unknown function DUF29